MSDVTTGFASQLLINIGAGLVKVAEVDDIPELPSFTATLFETSSFDTVDVKEFKKHPLKEGAEYTIAGNFVLGSTSSATLDAADAASGPLPYKIVLEQDDETYEVTGSALFYNLKYLNPGAEKRKFNITLKPTTRAPRAAAAGGA